MIGGRRRPLRTGVDAFVLEPGAHGGVILTHDRVPFKGRRIVNKGDSDGLFITNIFVGAERQTPPELLEETEEQHEYKVPLSTRAWDLAVCPSALEIQVRLKNESNEPRRVHFDIEGEILL